MSETVYVSGYMVPLKGTYDRTFLDNVREVFGDNDIYINFNYNQTLAYTFDELDSDDYYGLWFDSNKHDTEVFRELLNRGIKIEAEQIKHYRSIYYNGCDSPMATITLEQFKNGEFCE